MRLVLPDEGEEADEMSKLPQRITWSVSQDSNPVRAICVETSAPDRVRSFIKRHPGSMFITQPWGTSWDGRSLHQDELKTMRNGFYRQVKREPGFSPVTDVNDAVQVIERVATEFGITYSDLMAPISRRSIATKARGQAARELKRTMDLSLQQIADLLHLKDHSCVRYWLRQEPSKQKTTAGGKNAQ